LGRRRRIASDYATLATKRTLLLAFTDFVENLIELIKIHKAMNPALIVAINAFAALVPFLRFDRQCRDRPGFEPLDRNRLAGFLAIAVRVSQGPLYRAA
jgi:hypothetical protein